MATHRVPITCNFIKWLEKLKLTAVLPLEACILMRGSSPENGCGLLLQKGVVSILIIIGVSCQTYNIISARWFFLAVF